jgi:hypothetical protein
LLIEIEVSALTVKLLFKSSKGSAEDLTVDKIPEETFLQEIICENQKNNLTESLMSRSNSMTMQNFAAEKVVESDGGGFKLN